MTEAPSSNLPAVAAPKIFGSDGLPMTLADERDLSLYNFRSPGFLAQADLRQLSVLHKRFVQNLSARLSTFLRMECALSVGKFISSTFATYCEGLPSPSHITLFSIEPLKGVGIVNFTLPLGLAMADRLLGGKGKVIGEERALTEIEVALVEDAVQLVITEWTHLWADDEDGIMRPQCIGHETSARFLQTSSPDTVFVMMEVEMAVGEITSTFSMGIPFSMIEIEVKKIQRARLQNNDDRIKNVQWRSTHANIEVPVVAEWQIREMSLLEAMQVRVGDLIELPMELIDKTSVRLNTTQKFVGRVGVQNGCVAVQINEQIPEL